MKCFLCNNEMKRSKNDLYWICSCGIISSGQSYDSLQYDSSYAKHYIYLEGNKKTKRLNEIRRNWAMEFLPDRGMILDVGCCAGTFLSYFDSAFGLHGYDVNKFAIKIAELFHPAPTYYDEFCKIRNINFDLITMFDVIEHFQDPLRCLGAIESNLKKDGVVLISTPNAGIYPVNKIPVNWRHFKPKEHLHYFTKKTIKKTMEKAGLKVIELDYRETEVRNTYHQNIICIAGRRE